MAAEQYHGSKPDFLSRSQALNCGPAAATVRTIGAWVARIRRSAGWSTSTGGAAGARRRSDQSGLLCACSPAAGMVVLVVEHNHESVADSAH